MSILHPSLHLCFTKEWYRDNIYTSRINTRVNFIHFLRKPNKAGRLLRGRWIGLRT